MPNTRQTLVVDAATAGTLLAPRSDIVTERPWTEEDQAAWEGRHPGDDPRDEGWTSFAVERGPMRAYRRDVHTAAAPDGGVEVEERIRYQLALGVWSVAVAWVSNRALRRVDGRRSGRGPVWAPPEGLDARSGTVLGVLLSLSLLAGYTGTVLTQTITYAADEFDRGATAQGNVLAVVRIGVLGALAIVALSDRRGRRRLLLWSVGLAIGATAAGAFAPTIEVLGATQIVAQAFQGAVTLLLAVVAAEEMPAGSRAYAISVMTMTGALGAGVAVWALPLADVGLQGWRIIYLIPLLGLPVLTRVARTLPESQRFVRPHREATVLRGHARRFWAVGAALFCASAFAAPSSQLLNDFLKDERGFSAAQISLFIILTSTPAGLALVAGGRLADTRGRRAIVAIGVAGGAVIGAWGFTTYGAMLWFANFAGTMLGALSVPALGIYGAELFPTAARGKANGVLRIISVTGSALGVVVAGRAIDRTGNLSDGMFMLLPLALLVAVLALTVFPETARRPLEDINPEDDLTVPGEGEVIVPDPHR